MEAATPLRQAQVRTVGDRVVVDGLVVEDECAVRLVREREQRGDDPVRAIRDAVEIGARVLDREQTGANAEYVKAEFEKASQGVQQEFTDKARTIAEYFERQFAEVFGEDEGQLAKELERRFGDGSAVSVQNRVREAVAETLTKSREDLVRQFSAADDRNPLADFKSAAVREIQQAAGRSDATQRALLQKLGELQKELQALRDRRTSSTRSRPSASAGRPRGGPSRSRSSRRSTGSPPPRATTPRPSVTCARPPARWATSWWRSTPATVRRGAASWSRPRTGGCRGRRRWPSSTRR